MPGYPYDQLASDYGWTWYDNKSFGSTDWVLVANPNPDANSSVEYQIKISGITEASGTLGGGQMVTPAFPNLMAGPVEVTSSGGPVIASQCVIWQGHFNEVMGKGM